MKKNSPFCLDTTRWLDRPGCCTSFWAEAQDKSRKVIIWWTLYRIYESSIFLSFRSYVIDILCGDDEDQSKGAKLLEKIEEIISMVSLSSNEPVNKEQWKAIEKKLEKCRNEANNPDGNQYKRRMGDAGDESSQGNTATGPPGSNMDPTTKKYIKPSQDQKRRDEDHPKKSKSSSSGSHHSSKSHSSTHPR